MSSTTSKTKLKTTGRKSSSQGKTTKPSQGSLLRSILETIFFLGWLIITGVTGYFTGISSYSENCPEVTSSSAQIGSSIKCPPMPAVEQIVHQNNSNTDVSSIDYVCPHFWKFFMRK